ncbi:MAG: 3-deoxy-D-manno-octulosonic acid transferase [Alphaproteobacteria bacterium]
MGVLTRSRGRRVPALRAYNTLLLAAGAAAAPAAGAIALVRPGWRRGLAERFGRGWRRPHGSPVAWAHAASVGEVEGLAPLVDRWRAERPGGAVVVSSLTATGADAARRRWPDLAVHVLPLDAPWLVRRVVARVSPDLFLFSENELWPNLLRELARRDCPTVQVSGRMSERGARTLGRFPRFASDVLGCVSLFCVQGEDHRGRLLDLGVDGERVVVTGSRKGDGTRADPPWFAARLRDAARPVFVAGATRTGEEPIVLDALAELGSEAPFLVVAPRHPERFDEVADLAVARGLRVIRRSGLADGAAVDFGSHDVLLLDSLGELAGVYAGADVAFVGGTLVPVGGHNLLEAARAGVPVIVGPHRDKVREFSDALVAAGAGAVVPDARGLAVALRGFLAPGAARTAGEAARELAARQSGGLEATWRAIVDLEARRGAGG